jgi:predicted phage terminase large subunit-like protein
MDAVLDKITLGYAVELYERRRSRKYLLDYIKYTTQDYVLSAFAEQVCSALDQFILDVQDGKRPILILQAPPQHGKSEIVSRKLPAFLLGLFPEMRIAAASYSSKLAYKMALSVRRNLAAPEHKTLFPPIGEKRKYTKDTNSEFTSPRGNGSYISDGIGGGFTGMPADIFVIDDPTKNAEEGLSETTKESHWNWFQSTCQSRMSKNSGLIVMATSWAQDDLPGRIAAQYKGDPRLTNLRFPAINSPDETGYQPHLALGALIPELHPLSQLLELKAGTSSYWWSAMYQQAPKALGGNVFREKNDAGLPCIQFYYPKDLPKKFDKIINSWDCTFKDSDGTDYVVGQAWGKIGANSYLLDQDRDRMSFSKTVLQVVAMRKKWEGTSEVLIEDKANGPAVIDVLKKEVPGLVPIEPDGSKLARAHAVTWVWEAQNIFIPHPDVTPWVKAWIDEITIFDKGANDDQVDAFTQALRRLYPLFGKLAISSAALAKALGR